MSSVIEYCIFDMNIAIENDMTERSSLTAVAARLWCVGVVVGIRRVYTLQLELFSVIGFEMNAA